MASNTHNIGHRQKKYLKFKKLNHKNFVVSDGFEFDNLGPA